MSMAVEILTYFDITPTGVVHYRKSVELDTERYNFMRNQQRNYDTIIQCISLRCNPSNIQTKHVVVEDHLMWCMYFEIDKEDIYWKDNDPLGLLKEDCEGVPMIIGLEETYKDGFFHPHLITKGISANISFSVV